ncbi:MAG: hypothetical protein EBX37_12315 [Alphaproteobacteria bacterium]|nr:hypothetical protein [Alphaproteobacteria bacterium]
MKIKAVSCIMALAAALLLTAPPAWSQQERTATELGKMVEELLKPILAAKNLDELVTACRASAPKALAADKQMQSFESLALIGAVASVCQNEFANRIFE